jgi:hypothetical protein
MLACGADPNTNEFREDVLWCEDAVARLASCCPQPGLGNIKCYYYSSGCDSPSQVSLSPALSISESRCIRDLDCAALRDRGVCARAVPVEGFSSSTTTSTGGTTASTSSQDPPRGPVCP